MNTIASIGAPLLWGIALASLLHGVPIGSDQNFAGDFGDLFSGYTVLAGIAVGLLFAAHGAVFLTLRTVGELCTRATTRRRRSHAGGGGRRCRVPRLDARRRERPTTTRASSRESFPSSSRLSPRSRPIWLVRAARDRWAFVATTTTIVAVVVTLFVSLYPRVMVSNPDFANSLTIENASSADYTLKVMTVVAAILLPIILLYQAWTYHVFRARITGTPVGSPADLLGRKPAE